MISRIPFKLDDYHFYSVCRIDQFAWEATKDAAKGRMREQVRMGLADNVARAKIETLHEPNYVELRADIYVFTPAELFAVIEQIRNEALPRPPKPVEDMF